LGYACIYLFLTAKAKPSYVIALRPNRECPGVCSNLMGWHAVAWKDESVRDFDPGKMQIGHLAGTSAD
jgi:hypothetical protein